MARTTKPAPVPTAASKASALARGRMGRFNNSGNRPEVIIARNKGMGSNTSGRVGPTVGAAAQAAAQGAASHTPPRNPSGRIGPAAMGNARKAAERAKASSGTSSYSAGDTVYGGGRPMPTVGPVDRTGYKERDLQNKAKRNALLRRLQAGRGGKFRSSEYLKGES